ncbi:hypothetical protein PspLS_11699 [Pyricularia sp. CBS 133598]|nr:hypothetical protein PspLS_11699 [Pyricularia sp. CBS 133598]
MKILAAIITLLAAGGVVAVPHPVADEKPTRTHPLSKRATTVCGQWDSVQTGGYTVYNNLWGKDSGTGSQCLTVDGVSNGLLSWSTTWSWSGGQYNVKSYPNAVISAPAARLSAISSIPTRWQWRQELIHGPGAIRSYTGNSMVANVAYDLFTNSNCGTTPEYEIMVWIGAYGGAGPISQSGQPIASPNIGGVTWRLYKGSHSQMTVFSFVSPGQITNYSGDLVNFVRYLTQSQGMPASQCLYSAGAGTEPFTGSNARFTTSGYSMSISTSGSGGGGGGGANPPNCAALYGQCGGSGWSGPTCCAQGTCKAANQWYSQCS